MDPTPVSDRRRTVGRIAAAVAVVALALSVVVARPDGVGAAWAEDCTSPTATYDAATMPTDLNIDGDDRVLFVGGTFTGSINSSGAIICVDVGAAFNPSSINGAADLLVRGTAVMPPLAAGDGASLDNEGTVTFLPQPNTNGIAEVTNRAGATITVVGPGVTLPLGPGVTVTNAGTIVVEGGVNLNGSTVINDGDISIGSTLNISGIVTNNGTMSVGGVLTVNGNGTLVNACSLTAGSLINDNAVDNRGVIDLGAGELRNNAGQDYVQGTDAVTLGDDLINSGSVSGSGQYLFTGSTLTQGSFVGASAEAPIVVFDVTQTGSQIFDTQLGTIANVVRQEVVPPPPGSCTATPPTTTTTSTSTSTTSTSTTSTSTTSTSTTSTSTTSTSTTSTTTTSTSTTSTTTTSTTTTSTSTTSTSTTSTTSTTTTTQPSSSSSSSSTSSSLPASSSTSGPSVLPSNVERPPSSDPSDVLGGAGGDSGVGGSGLARTGPPGSGRLAAVGLVLLTVGLVLTARARQVRGSLWG